MAMATSPWRELLQQAMQSHKHLKHHTHLQLVKSLPLSWRLKLPTFHHLYVVDGSWNSTCVCIGYSAARWTTRQPNPCLQVWDDFLSLLALILSSFSSFPCFRSQQTRPISKASNELQLWEVLAAEALWRVQISCSSQRTPGLTRRAPPCFLLFRSSRSKVELIFLTWFCNDECCVPFGADWRYQALSIWRGMSRSALSALFFRSH